jgi:hypothetical protein
MSQKLQALPLMPQFIAEGGMMQVLLLQQPGHDVESHTHWPPEQCWPVPHATAPPQVHWPPMHPSATLVLHAVQSVPAAPQFARLQLVQAALVLQQPPVQLCASQMHWPAEQRWPKPHDGNVPQVQAPLVQLLPTSQTVQVPLPPQAAELLPGWHCPVESQQPEAQFV